MPAALLQPVLLDQVRLKYADTTPPTVAITSSAAGETAKGPVTFTFTFSEDVGDSFTAEDIAVAGSTAGTFTRVSGTLATLVVTPPANAAGTITVSVAAGKFYDAAYNANTASAAVEQAFDTRGAMVSGLPITFDDPAVTYTLTGFGGAEAASVVADPTGGANQVAQVTKSATAELWAGITVSTGPNFSIAADPVHGDGQDHHGAGVGAGGRHPDPAEGGGCGGRRARAARPRRRPRWPTPGRR